MFFSLLKHGKKLVEYFSVCPLFSPVWGCNARQTWNLKCGSVTKPEKAGKHYRIQIMFLNFKKTQQHISTNPLIGKSLTKPNHELDCFIVHFRN